MAYVLGFFAADGTMIKNNRGAHFIEFDITDRSVLLQIRRVMGSNHKIAVRIRNPQHKVGYRLQVGSKRMFTDLVELGFSQRKSLTLQLPQIPIELSSHFVRGYFDGDGCVYYARLKFADRKNRRQILNTLFTCGTRTFLKSLHTLLKSQGVSGGTIRTKRRGFDLSLSHRDSLALYKLMYNTGPATGLYLPRKYKTFQRAIKNLYPDAAVV